MKELSLSPDPSLVIFIGVAVMGGLARLVHYLNQLINPEAARPFNWFMAITEILTGSLVAVTVFILILGYLPSTRLLVAAAMSWGIAHFGVRGAYRLGALIWQKRLVIELERDTKTPAKEP